MSASFFFSTVFVRQLSSLSVIVILPLLVPCRVAIASDGTTPSMTTAPLSTDQVVSYLVRRNEERSRRLLHSRSTRVYHLTYLGFGGDIEADMTVESFYYNPSTKDFKVISESGPTIIVERVFKKLLESEKEAAQPEMRARMLLNSENYNFKLVGYERSGNQYLLQVSPKAKSKYVYRGQIWVDGNDFAVTRIEAEPAQNPSFWTKKSEIHQEYVKIQDLWLPVRNKSVSNIRFGGRAILTIEYRDYHLTKTGDASAIMSGPANIDLDRRRIEVPMNGVQPVNKARPSQVTFTVGAGTATSPSPR